MQTTFGQLNIGDLFVFQYESDILIKPENRGIPLKTHLPVLYKFEKVSDMEYRPKEILVNNTDKNKKLNKKMRGYTYSETPVLKV